jgi:hypothetical protein
MADRKAGAPEITEVQRAFVKASQEAETTRLEEERAQLEVIRKRKRRRRSNRGLSHGCWAVWQCWWAVASLGSSLGSISRA